MSSGYGVCPKCGREDDGHSSRERCVNGNTTCSACGESTLSSTWADQTVPPQRKASKIADTAPLSVTIEDEDDDTFNSLEKNNPYHSDEAIFKGSKRVFKLAKRIMKDT
jgi:RNA polymerase subunit RPABC4/transcription elongation factor Spt4